MSLYLICLFTLSVCLPYLSVYLISLFTWSVCLPCLSVYLVCLFTWSVYLPYLSVNLVCLLTLSVSLPGLSVYLICLVLRGVKRWIQNNETNFIELFCELLRKYTLKYPNEKWNISILLSIVLCNCIKHFKIWLFPNTAVWW